MHKYFLPLLFPDFLKKISNFPDFSWSSNKFPDFFGVEPLPMLVEIPRSKAKTHQGVIQKTFLGGGSTKFGHICDQLGICTEYTYISGFIEVWSRQWSAGDLYRVYIYQWVHTLTASGYVCEGKMSKNTKFSTSSSF